MNGSKFGKEDPAATNPGARGAKAARRVVTPDLFPGALTVDKQSGRPNDVDEQGVMLTHFSLEKKLAIHTEFDKIFRKSVPLPERVERFERSVLLAHHPRLLMIEAMEDWAKLLPDNKTREEAEELVKELFKREDERVQMNEIGKLAELTAGEMTAVGRMRDGLEFILQPHAGPSYFHTDDFRTDVCDWLERSFVIGYPAQLIALLSEKSYAMPEAAEALNVIRIEHELENVFVREVRDFVVLHAEDLATDLAACEQEIRKIATTDLMRRHPRTLKRAFERLRKECPADRRILDRLEASIASFQT